MNKHLLLYAYLFTLLFVGVSAAGTPLAHWKMTVTNGRILDVSGNHHDGALYGTTQPMTGIKDTGLAFGGTSRVSVSPDRALSTGSFSIELVFKKTGEGILFDNTLKTTQLLGDVDIKAVSPQGVLCSQTITIKKPAARCVIRPISGLIKGSPATIYADCMDSAGNRVECPDLIWRSSRCTTCLSSPGPSGNARIVTYSPLQSGGDDLSATFSADSTKFCTRHVEVAALPATKCTLPPPSSPRAGVAPGTLDKGSPATLTVTCLDSTNTEVQCPTTTWTSKTNPCSGSCFSRPQLVGLKQAIDYRPITPGADTITASFGDKSCTVDVIVPYMPAISCPIPALVSMRQGETKQFTFTCLDITAHDQTICPDVSFKAGRDIPTATQIGFLASDKTSKSITFTYMAPSNIEGDVYLYPHFMNEQNPGGKNPACWQKINIVPKVPAPEVCSFDPGPPTSMPKGGTKQFTVKCYRLGKAAECGLLVWTSDANLGTLTPMVSSDPKASIAQYKAPTTRSSVFLRTATSRPDCPTGNLRPDGRCSCGAIMVTLT
ncbi:hypothetical protein HY639_01510 [Candidatus Woesearchaeota archaeon]|nr:hypothetical protein [Candidatus Woesearchaeota archaeon]